MKLRNMLIIGAVSLTMASCRSNKDTVLPYFADIETVQATPIPTGNYMPEIQPDDELFITVTSLNPMATAIYNLPVTNPAQSSDIVQSMTPRQQTYIVNSEGNINFPILGTIHVAGMTTDQLQTYLTKEIGKSVEDPNVRVQLLNFTVVVAGEVNQPSRINVNRNRFSILDAISSAGDLTPYGKRDNILLVREENGERKFVHLNLNSADLLESPYYYLQQNDYIYVTPNEIRQANSRYNQDNAYKLQVTSTVVSAASVIASLVIALTVK